MIYWDNNATTPLAPEVLEAMMPFLRELFYNPSSASRAARRVRAAVEGARERVAALVGADASEVVFTSGGTESTNTALAQFDSVLMLATEHPATLRTGRGDVCPVLHDGRADAEAWRRLLPGHDGVSFAWANHETGVIQPVELLCEAAREAGARVHVDVVQAAGKVPLSLHEAGVDFASMSAHKIHGPKGIGALFIRRGAECHPLLTGGSQEDYRRAGTENVPGIVGFGKAAELALEARELYAALAERRDLFVRLLREAGLDPVVNGEGAPRLPHVCNVRFPGLKAEGLSLLLEPAGLLCSTGSACTSAEPHPSHVLLAMGLSDAQVRESLRFSMCRYTTVEEVQEAARIVVEAVRKLRSVQSAATGPVLVYR